MADVFHTPWIGGNAQAPAEATPGLVAFPAGRAGADVFATSGARGLPQLGGVVRGKIVQSFAALNLYDVSTDGKSRVLGLYIGGNSGGGSDPLGSQQLVTFHPGTEVWVVICPKSAGVEALILGAASRPVRSYLPQRAVVGYPQVAGLDIKRTGSSPSYTYTGNHTVSRQVIASKLGIVKDINSANADVVEGDWVVLSYYGGGIGVEAFKSWLGAGPMNSLIVYNEDELTRLTGINYQFATMSEDYEDMRVGRTMRSIRKKVYFPSDALLANLPQVIEVDGSSYIGRHAYQTYRDKDNALAIPTAEGAPPASADTSRQALIHEYRGTDGTFVLTAAASLTLQKWVGVQTPIPIQPASTPTTIDQFPNTSKTFTDQPKVAVNFPAPDPRLPEQALETDAQQLTVLKDLYTASGTDYPAVGGVVDIGKLANQASIYATVYAGNRVLSALGFQAARAFRTYTSLWKYGAIPRYLQRRGDNHPTPGSDSPDWPDPSNYDVGMWKRVPKSVVINLNSYGMSKRIFLGRAIITITDEGGIVLQDAYGSQIVMSGGNIYLTAEHDVITNAGRNSITLAGQDAATMAYRNVEAWADGGHLSMGASLQVALVGGNGGHGGVTIESRSVGTGADDGVLVRSASRLTLLGQNVDAKACSGSLALSSNTPIFFRTGDSATGTSNYGALSTDGVYFGSSDISKPTAYLSIYGAYMPSLSVSGAVNGGKFAVVTPGSSPLGVTRAAYTKLATAANLQLFDGDFYENDSTDRYNAIYGPKFLQSYAYSVPATDSDMFGIPQAEWQRRIDVQDKDLPGGVAFRLKCIWKINTLRQSPISMRISDGDISADYTAGSMPYPGYDLWASHGYVAQVPDGRSTLKYETRPIFVGKNPANPVDSLDVTHRGI